MGNAIESWTRNTGAVRAAYFRRKPWEAFHLCPNQGPKRKRSARSICFLTFDWAFQSRSSPPLPYVRKDITNEVVCQICRAALICCEKSLWTLHQKWMMVLGSRSDVINYNLQRCHRTSIPGTMDICGVEPRRCEEFTTHQQCQQLPCLFDSQGSLFANDLCV